MGVSDYYKDACLVEVAHHSVWKNLSNNGLVGKENNEDVHCSSGILISQSHGYVLTHGSILLNHLNKNRNIMKKMDKMGHIQSNSFRGLRAMITLDPVFSSTSSSDKSSTDVKSFFALTSSSRPENKHKQYMGTIELVWKAERFAKTIQSFLPTSDGWSFFEDPKPDCEPNTSDRSDIDPNLIAQLLPYFVVIKLDKWTNIPKENTILHVCDCHLKIGEAVHMVGTPFGSMSPSVFMNSLSQGVVCNTAGSHQELIITDARCIPGTEGGPLYYGTAKQRCGLLGIVASALCWKANEWIGLSLACHIGEILHSLGEVIQLPELVQSVKKIKSPIDQDISSVELHQPDSFKADSLPIVLVKCGGTWGTGLIVDQKLGLVLTCGHVVKNHSRGIKIRVDHPRPQWFDADVLHATPQNQVFDVGLLHLDGYVPRDCWPNRISIVNSTEEGDVSFVVGHAMFGHHLNLPASVTSGVISKVIRSQGAPVIIQSTCTVNAGASGGPIVSMSGKVIGVVACNAKDTGSGATYPNINLSVPIQTIWPALTQYFEKQDPTVLSSLHIQNDDITALWTMQGTRRTFEGIKSKL